MSDLIDLVDLLIVKNPNYSSKVYKRTFGKRKLKPFLNGFRLGFASAKCEELTVKLNGFTFHSKEVFSAVKGSFQWWIQDFPDHPAESSENTAICAKIRKYVLIECIWLKLS